MECVVRDRLVRWQSGDRASLWREVELNVVKRRSMRLQSDWDHVRRRVVIAAEVAQFVGCT